MRKPIDILNNAKICTLCKGNWSDYPKCRLVPIYISDISYTFLQSESPENQNREKHTAGIVANDYSATPSQAFWDRSNKSIRTGKYRCRKKPTMERNAVKWHSIAGAQLDACETERRQLSTRESVNKSEFIWTPEWLTPLRAASTLLLDNWCVIWHRSVWFGHGLSNVSSHHTTLCYIAGCMQMRIPWRLTPSHTAHSFAAEFQILSVLFVV